MAEQHQQMQQQHPHQGQQQHITAQILNVQGGVATLDDSVPVQIMMPSTVVMEDHHHHQQVQEQHHPVQVPQHVQEMQEAVIQEAVGSAHTSGEDPKIANKKELSKQWKSLCKKAKQWCGMHDDSIPNFVMMYLDENRLVWEGPDHMESFISDESVISAFLRTSALSESLIGMEKRGVDDAQDVPRPAKKQKKPEAPPQKKGMTDDEVIASILEKPEAEMEDAARDEQAGGDDDHSDVDTSQPTEGEPSQSTSAEGQPQGGEGDVLSQVIESVIKDWAPGQGPPRTEEEGDGNGKMRLLQKSKQFWGVVRASELEDEPDPVEDDQHKKRELDKNMVEVVVCRLPQKMEKELKPIKKELNSDHNYGLQEPAADTKQEPDLPLPNPIQDIGGKPPNLGDQRHLLHVMSGGKAVPLLLQSKSSQGASQKHAKIDLFCPLVNKPTILLTPSPNIVRNTKARKAEKRPAEEARKPESKSLADQDIVKNTNGAMISPVVGSQETASAEQQLPSSSPTPRQPSSYVAHNEHNYALDSKVPYVYKSGPRANPSTIPWSKRLRSCPNCSKLVTYKNFSDHMRSHSDARPYKCGVCDATFRYCNSLRQHKRTHLTEKPFKCDECSKGFIFPKELRYHKEQHARKKDAALVAAGLPVPEREKFDRPSRIESLCEFCAKVLSSKACLLKHIEVCHPNGEISVAPRIEGKRKLPGDWFQCPFCDHCCLNRRLLKRHIRTKHPAEDASVADGVNREFIVPKPDVNDPGPDAFDPRISCAVCTKIVVKKNLAAHMRVHRQKPGGASQKSKSRLNQPMEIHVARASNTASEVENVQPSETSYEKLGTNFQIPGIFEGDSEIATATSNILPDL